MALSKITADSITANVISSALIATSTITGDKIAAATIGSSNLTSTGVSSGSYGGTGNTVSIIVDAQGRITSAANVASVATAPAGTTNQIQFNNAGAFGANPSFSFDGTNFTLDGSTKVQVFGSGSKIQMQTPTASANWYFETAGTNLTASSAQSGQFNIQNATAVTTFGVGGTTPSASGAGITFPATQSASSDANTLDDYEEGTWTPSLGGNTTYYTQTGTYTKIGNIYYIRGNMHVNSLGTGSSSIISGLPFGATGDDAISVSYFDHNVSVYWLNLYTQSTNLRNRTQVDFDGAVTTGSALYASGKQIVFSGVISV